MPEIVIAMHELRDRHEEIPDTDDCFLVGIWNDEIPEEAVDPEPFYPTPWLASKVAALSAARDSDDDAWNYHYKWDGDPDHRHVRVDCNTLTVFHPIYMRFRWGEGQPSVDGVVMLPCVDAIYLRGPMGYCDYCGKEMPRTPNDCMGRRLRAMAKGILQGTNSEHVKAVGLWHSQTLGEKWEERSRREEEERKAWNKKHGIENDDEDDDDDGEELAEDYQNHLDSEDEK